MDSPGPAAHFRSPWRAKSAAHTAISPGAILHDPLFRDLSQISGDMVLLLGQKGRQIVGANPRFSKLLGYAKRDLRASGVLAVFADPQAAQEVFQSVWSGTRDVSARVSCLHKNGHLIPATMRARLLPESANQLALVVIHPETAAESPSRHEQGHTLSRLLHIPEEVASARDLNFQRHIQMWLRRVCRAAQFPVADFHLLREDIGGTPHFSHAWHVASAPGLDPIRRDPFRVALPPEFHSRVAAARVPQTIPDLSKHWQFQSPEIRALHLSSAVAVPVTIGREVGAVCVFYLTDPLSRDSLLVDVIRIVARELGFVIYSRSLSMRLTKIQDDERRRLASELHDTVAQSLSILLLDLDTVQQESRTLGDGGRAALARATSLAGQSLQEIRTFSYLLHPPVLDALGLLPALRVFIDNFSRRSGIRVVSELPNSLPRLTHEWEIAVFRVVQEGLTNVQRHSHSVVAEVLMTVAAGMVTLQVINEGAAPPPLESGGLPFEKAGVGIGGMRERLGAFGGDVQLYSRYGKTVLEASIPLPKISRSPQLPLKF